MQSHLLRNAFPALCRSASSLLIRIKKLERSISPVCLVATVAVYTVTSSRIAPQSIDASKLREKLRDDCSR